MRFTLVSTEEPTVKKVVDIPDEIIPTKKRKVIDRQTVKATVKKPPKKPPPKKARKVQRSRAYGKTHNTNVKRAESK